MATGKIGTTTGIASAASALLIAAGAASAQSLSFDQNVTPDVIFGSGNTNGSFTVGQSGGVEIGLRGKLRFNSSNSPENTFNSNGDGTYTFQAGNPPTGFGFDPNSPTTPVWNFEWSVNTDYNGASGLALDDLTYELSLDADPSSGVNAMTFDPITVTSGSPPDHAIGNNSTANGDGLVASDIMDYGTLLAQNNVAQNSWSYEFFNDSGPLAGFDPNDVGEYEISLAAFDSSGTVVSRSTITIQVVPAPGAAAVLGLGGLIAARRRRA